ncbi:hypothetical protein F3J27_22500 [Enterobacter sp. Ap-916]|uniref:hypothetical protein n=1 Tax=Enterobacteriaceae TaxID=543 RepID=UPI000272999A|nr:MULTISPECIES: hypothetical protein [unclassified Enterobacter]EJF30889.1 hypothetical protein A936_13142 [Enterobacter sp. Ag1]NIF61087.1 hypothetical protein [Enterobacter sp. Ap-867]NIG32235.1 hypothetical protein [Enterobacter sp. Ap-916]
MDKCACWPENEPLSGKGFMAIAEIAGRENLYFVNLDEFPFYIFLICPQVFNLKRGIVIPCQALYPLPLLLLTEFTSVYAIFPSDCRPERVAGEIRQAPDNGEKNIQYSETRFLTPFEFRLLHLFMRAVSMKDIPCTILCTACVYQELSEKMQLTHKGMSVYMKRCGI